MYNTSLPNSLPNPAACFKANLLTPHFQRNDVELKLGNGDDVKTCHIVADGRDFNFRVAFDSDFDWQYLIFRELSYTDAEGMTQIVKVIPRGPHLIHKQGQSLYGYVTKIREQRWGVNIHMDWNAGLMSIRADDGSPITGCLFQFIE